MRVSEIHVKQIRVNQGLGVFAKSRLSPHSGPVTQYVPNPARECFKRWNIFINEQYSPEK